VPHISAAYYAHLTADEHDLELDEKLGHPSESSRATKSMKNVGTFSKMQLTLRTTHKFNQDHISLEMNANNQ
jgi:hypothetical protein